MTTTVSRQQRGLSVSRILVACFTFGLSVPWLGVRRVRRETVTTK